MHLMETVSRLQYSNVATLRIFAAVSDTCFMQICVIFCVTKTLKSSKAEGILDLIKLQRQEIRHRILSKVPPVIEVL
jgi:hypothetical protein